MGPEHLLRYCVLIAFAGSEIAYHAKSCFAVAGSGRKNRRRPYQGTRCQRRERNDRVVAMPLKAPRFDHLRKAGDLPARIRHELETFFVAVTALEGKDVRILGWGGPEAALRLIRRSAIGD